MAVASLVLGILGVVFGALFFTFYLAMFCGMMAFTAGSIGRRRAREEGAPHERLATTGIVLGFAALAVSIVDLVIFYGPYHAGR
jgi:uncharacterized protein DUF4190